MERLLNNKLHLIFLTVAGIFLALSIVGGIRAYTPIPFYDMWNATLGFYLDVQNGNHSLWFSQHNEHRPLLSRILFWLDFKLFNGQVYFLIFMNYVLAGFGFWVIYKALEEILPRKEDALTKICIGSVIFCVIFSWMQKENFVWGFQSQFFLAQSLPLIAFYLLHRSFISTTHSRSLFIAACILGCVSILTMANGILALPLMLIFALILRMQWQKIAVLIALTVLTFWAYFYEYTSPAHHGSLSQAITQDPLSLIKYLALYLGSPFFNILGKPYPMISAILAFASVIFLMISALFFSIQSLKSPKTHSLQLALLFFILYIAGTAIGTGGSRVIFGFVQALSDRYTTPVLMAWAVLLLLYTPFITQIIHKKKQYALFLLLIPIMLIPEQIKALRNHDENIFEKKLAVLSLALGVNDIKQYSYVGPESLNYYQYTLNLAKRASSTNVSVFNHPYVKNASTAIGTQVQRTDLQPLVGNVDSFQTLDNDPHYVKVQGWIVEQDVHKAQELIYLVSGQQKIVGVALTGASSKDFKRIQFKGYLLSEETNQPIEFLN